jgi:hypothetical protein
MATFESLTKSSGSLGVRKISPPSAPFSWHIKNRSRTAYWTGRFNNWRARQFSKQTGIPTLTSELSIRLFKANSDVIDYGIVEYRVVTTAWVNFIVDNLQADTTEFGDLKFHDSGVGTTAADVSDTDIETTDGESRATGSQIEGASANIYRSVGTIAYTTTKAITEHVLATQATGGTIIDRHVFAAVNVENGDSIQFAYEWTANSGG